jgi:hypothetical protein
LNAFFMSPVYDPAGELVYFFGSQPDVSRRDAADALCQSQKMGSPSPPLTAGGWPAPPTRAA